METSGLERNGRIIEAVRKLAIQYYEQTGKLLAYISQVNSLTCDQLDSGGSPIDWIGPQLMTSARVR